ncbi:MAG: lysophospholipid acyltransferase family protein [Bacteroidetes bacterium]|nr:lysophospholipid acyltransferase family protein [Bacteroidota bacterium]MCW5894445.1 lysophospholipid acyltransferase family protein [Bacteroidota bacterium]
MIEANKNVAFKTVFSLYNTRLLRRHFFRVHLGGLEHIRQLDRTRPVLFIGNHCCWWDGLIEYHLATEVLDADIYLMMEERQMVRYRFFRWLGAFSVRRESPRSSVESMQYAASLFDTPNRFLWMYPQGEMKPNDVRPLGFFPGAARIIQMVGRPVQVVPFARRYEFLMEQRPEAFTLFGKPMLVDPAQDFRETTEQFEHAVTGLLDTLRCKIADSDMSGFKTVLKGSASTNNKYDAVRMK